MSFNTVPAGRYPAHATKAEFRTSQNTGTEWVAVTFVIDEGEHQGAEVEWWGFLSEKAVGRTMENLLTMGFTGDDVLDFIERCPESAPAPVVIKVKVEEYNGKTTARVDFIDKPGGSSIGVPADERDAIRARTKAAMAEARARLGLPPAPSRPIGGGSGARSTAHTSSAASKQPYQAKPQNPDAEPAQDDIPF
jgi:hypothetical protein